MRRIFSMISCMLLLGIVSEQAMTAAPHKKYHSRTHKRHKVIKHAARR